MTRNKSPVVEEREVKLEALRKMLNRSIEKGGEVTETELDTALDAKAAELMNRGPLTQSAAPQHEFPCFPGRIPPYAAS